MKDVFRLNPFMDHPLMIYTADLTGRNTPREKTNNFYTLGMTQFSSVTQSCPTLCDPMNCSTPGLPVHHQLPEFTQTHVH